MRAQAPSVGIHLPTPKDRIAAHTPNQMNASAKRYLPTFPRSPKNVLNVVDGGDAEQAAHPHRVREPVEDGVDRGDEAPEREARPDVAAALARERRPELRGQEGVGHEEEDGQEDQPGEAFRPVVRDRPQRVHADERADEEEQHVEASEVLLELRLLLLGREGLVVGVQHDMVGRHGCTRHRGAPPPGVRVGPPSSRTTAPMRTHPRGECNRQMGAPEPDRLSKTVNRRAARTRPSRARPERRGGAPRACAAHRPARSSARSR